jgi:hypothetical protein
MDVYVRIRKHNLLAFCYLPTGFRTLTYKVGDRSSELRNHIRKGRFFGHFPVTYLPLSWNPSTNTTENLGTRLAKLPRVMCVSR